MKCDLSEKKCKPCEGEIDPLSIEESNKLLNKVAGWQLISSGKIIQRRFEFKGFNKTIGFINAIAWIANQQQHHPDVTFGYNYCEVNYTTHAIDGLSENDFICASKINDLVN